MQRVAVIGADGQLGTDICSVFRKAGHKVFELNEPTIDVSDKEMCRAALEGSNPDVVINTAAMHQVEQCEEEPERAYAVNAIGPRHLAQLCEARNTLLVHVSTDYVFDGSKGSPYVETDTPLPLNVYGNTKLAGEHYVRALCRRHLVVRLSGLFGLAPCKAKGGLNFVQLMLKLARERGVVRVVDTEALCPTYTLDAAEQILVLTESSHGGLFHAASREGCSWHAFAEAIFELTGTTVNLEVAAPGEFPAKAPRPADSRLANAALDTVGINQMPHWTDGLKRYLDAI